jgi:hypothetical protein
VGEEDTRRNITQKWKIGEKNLNVLNDWVPLSDLRKGCVPRNFTQVEFYVKTEIIEIPMQYFQLCVLGSI